MSQTLHFNLPELSCSSVAPGLSSSSIGCAIVSIPSRITPTFWKKEVSAHMIHPVMAFSRSTSAEPRPRKTHRRRSRRPEVKTPAHHRDDQKTIQEDEHRVHPREDTHLHLEGAARLLNGFLGEKLLPFVRNIFTEWMLV